MRTTIDKAGRVVIPAGIRDRAGLTAGSEIEITADELGIRIERVAAGPAGQSGSTAGCTADGVTRRTSARRHRRSGRRRAKPLAVSVFLDMSADLWWGWSTLGCKAPPRNR